MKFKIGDIVRLTVHNDPTYWPKGHVFKILDMYSYMNKHYINGLTAKPGDLRPGTVREADVELVNRKSHLPKWL